MSKKEFLMELKELLHGQISNEEMYNHVKYYEDYIDSKINEGMSEEEVLNSLGQPRLIAKTILSSGNDKYSNNIYDNEIEEENSGKITFSINGKRIDGLITKIIGIILGILLCIVALFLIVGIGRILFFVIGRIVIPVVLIILVIRWIKNTIS